MKFTPSSLLVVLLGVALGILVPGEPAKPGVRKKRAGGPAASAPASASASAWEDAAFLQAEWERACEYAERAIGRQFSARPTLVISSPEALAPIVAAQMATWLGSASTDPKTTAGTVARLTPVFTDLAGNKVHVVPDAAQHLRKLYKDPAALPKDAGRLLLVHAAVRALDAESFPTLAAAVRERTEKDSLEAAFAVAVGHAAFRTQYIAGPANLNLEKTFNDLVRLMALPPGADTFAATLEDERALAQLAHASWIKGLAFIRELYNQKASLRDVLEAPPESMTLVERSDIYLASRRLFKAFDEERVLKELRKALERDDLTVSVDSAGRGAVEALLSAADVGRTGTVLASLRAAQTLRAVDSEGKVLAEAWLILLGDEKAAQAFLELRRTHEGEMEKRLADSPTPWKNASTSDGAGRDGGLPGFVMRRTEVTPDGESITLQQTTHEGPFVLQLLVRDNLVGREAQDDALEGAAEAILKLIEKPKPRR